MSRPPVSKATPLPTRVTRGASALPQVKSMRRGGVAEARPTAWIIGKFCFSRSSPTMLVKEAPCRSASCARGRLDAVGAEIARRRVDEIAACDDRIRDMRDFLGIDALRRHEANGFLAALAVTVEAVAAQKPGEGGERRVRRLGLEAIDALGQQGGELADEEGIVALGIGAVEAEGDAGEVSVRIGQQAMAPGLALEPLRLREALRHGRQASGNLGPGLFGHEPDRLRGVGRGGKEGMGHVD